MEMIIRIDEQGLKIANQIVVKYQEKDRDLESDSGWKKALRRRRATPKEERQCEEDAMERAQVKK